MYKQQGELLSAAFAKNLLQDKMTELAVEIVQSELAAKFATLDTMVASSLGRIESRFDEKKTMGGWMRDIGTSLISGIGLILILGTAVGGYAALAKFNAAVENTAGVNSTAAKPSAVEKASNAKNGGSKTPTQLPD